VATYCYCYICYNILWCLAVDKVYSCGCFSWNEDDYWYSAAQQSADAVALQWPRQAILNLCEKILECRLHSKWDDQGQVVTIRRLSYTANGWNRMERKGLCTGDTVCKNVNDRVDRHYTLSYIQHYSIGPDVLLSLHITYRTSGCQILITQYWRSGCATAPRPAFIRARRRKNHFAQFGHLVRGLSARW